MAETSRGLRIEALGNPHVLKWARQMAGLDPEDAAQKAVVKPERIALWESGSAPLTIAQLRKLADIYKRPLAMFFLDEPPPDDTIPTDFRRLDPDAEVSVSPRLRLAIRAARARRDAAIELFDELGDSPPVWNLQTRLTEDPEEVGSRFREALGVPVGAVPADARRAFNLWRAAAERTGLLVFQAEGMSVEEVRGFSLPDRPLPAVVINMRDAYAARSFSLFHEVTHISLNQGAICLVEEGELESTTGLGGERIEIFCNYVAGAALLPAATLLAEPETPIGPNQPMSDEAIETLAGRHGVSPEVLVRRLAILGRVSHEFYKRKRRQFEKRYEELRKKPKKGGGPSRARLAIARAGGLFTRKVLEAYDEERITSSAVAELLGERLKHLARIRNEVERMSETALPE